MYLPLPCLITEGYHHIPQMAISIGAMMIHIFRPGEVQTESGSGPYCNPDMDDVFGYPPVNQHRCGKLVENPAFVDNLQIRNHWFSTSILVYPGV